MNLDLLAAVQLNTLSLSADLRKNEHSVNRPNNENEKQCRNNVFDYDRIGGIGQINFTVQIDGLKFRLIIYFNRFNKTPM